eukprot:scaffold470298_cov18-Prasinocladus_malaysianus.AAC.1
MAGSSFKASASPKTIKALPPNEEGLAETDWPALDGLDINSESCSTDRQSKPLQISSLLDS